VLFSFVVFRLEHEHSVKEEEATDADDDEEDDKHADRVSGCLDALSQLAVPREGSRRMDATRTLSLSVCAARCRFTTLSCADSSRNPHILYCGDCKTELVDVSRASDTVMLGARSGGGSAISKFYRKHVFGLHLIDTRDGCRYVKELQTGTSTYARRGCVRLIPRGCFLVLSASRSPGSAPRSNSGFPDRAPRVAGCRSSSRRPLATPLRGSPRRGHVHHVAPRGSTEGPPDATAAAARASRPP